MWRKQSRTGRGKATENSERREGGREELDAGGGVGPSFLLLSTDARRHTGAPVYTEEACDTPGTDRVLRAHTHAASREGDDR